MARIAHERILLIGDSQQHVQAALSQTIPGAQVTSVDTVFDGIAELSANSYTAVLAAAEPIERRPEPAVRTLRDLAGQSRLVLFGHPTLEILSRKMLQFGCDDYIITPPNSAELQQIFGKIPMRLTPPAAGDAAVAAAPEAPAVPSTLEILADLPFADIFLDALLHSPHNAPNSAIRAVNARISPAMELRYVPNNGGILEVPAGTAAYSHAIRIGAEEIGTLYLLASETEDQAAVRHVLTQVAHSFGRMTALQDRHHRLQKLAITDDLTGSYNARYFRHFLTRIVDRARAMRFPVTLLLFDIDGFKKYNDLYGHGAGDEILKQTAQLMRRCCREHDLVARIGGDEFAVVFWDKEGPRQPLDGHKPSGPSRPPQTPVQMFERFKRLAASSDFSGLGTSGRGRLSVSGGLAVFPYDAGDVAGLIKAADDYLMFKAKKAGKNSIYLVEGDERATES